MIRTIRTGGILAIVISASLMLQGCIVGAVVGTAGAIVGGTYPSGESRLVRLKRLAMLCA